MQLEIRITGVGESLTVPETARVLKKSEAALAIMRSAGTGPEFYRDETSHRRGHNWNGTVRYKRAALEAWLLSAPWARPSTQRNPA